MTQGTLKASSAGGSSATEHCCSRTKMEARMGMALMNSCGVEGVESEEGLDWVERIAS